MAEMVPGVAGRRPVRVWRQNNFVYWAAWVFWWLFFRLYAPLRVSGAEFVPRRGPAILVCNHLSTLDAFATGLACRRRVGFLVKAEGFRPTPVGWLLRQLGAIPLKRWTRDPSAMRASLEVLKAGEVLGIFPEGTRSSTGELQTIRIGAAKIALKTGAPILPAVVTGTLESLPRGRFFPRPVPITVRFGSPFTLAGPASEEAVAAGAEMIRRRILDLMSATG
ncbi:MAG: 1-acyl-sn-glycerol-3-phosphate acyltransferase [Chloroflexi bacterium]|nr:1-acyl-sn-glycerol-3-phosphate acyltransferase [Chloroflexota bacterium]